MTINSIINRVESAAESKGQRRGVAGEPWRDRPRPEAAREQLQEAGVFKLVLEKVVGFARDGVENRSR